VRCTIDQQGGTRLLLLLEVRGEPDRTLRRCRWTHELTDRGEDRRDRLVVCRELLLDSRLELVETLRELLIGGQHFAQLHEGAHDVDADLDCTRAVQDRSGHNRAVLGEDVREIAPPAAASGSF